jgi:hypothetical protein
MIRQKHIDYIIYWTKIQANILFHLFPNWSVLSGNAKKKSHVLLEAIYSLILIVINIQYPEDIGPPHLAPFPNPTDKQKRHFPSLYPHHQLLASHPEIVFANLSKFVSRVILSVHSGEKASMLHGTIKKNIKAVLLSFKAKRLWFIEI